MKIADGYIYPFLNEDEGLPKPLPVRCVYVTHRRWIKLRARDGSIILSPDQARAYAAALVVAADMADQDSGR